jgi:hypothetical protein
MIMVLAFCAFHGFSHIAVIVSYETVICWAAMCIAESNGDGQPGRADFDGKSGPVIGNSRQPAGRDFSQRQKQKPFSP